MKTMILAAGLGTRLKPLTDKIPKALIKIKDKTLLEYVINALKNQGVDEIIINVHHYAQQVIDFVEINRKFDIQIEFSHETELMDTGGGLKKAAWFFNDNSPFILYNVDVLSNLDLDEMMIIHNKTNALVTLAVRSRKTSRYFLFDENNRLAGWENIESGEQRIVSKSTKDLQQLSFMGIHIISPKIFTKFPKEERFSIVKYYLEIAGDNLIKGFRGDAYSWVDCGKPENLSKANNFNNLL
jgi:NDP-sugar pyrophosphorylase family protein